MRLIDADYLKKLLNTGGDEKVEISIRESMPLEEIVDTVIHAYRKCLFAELEKVPTAYDMNEVIKQLKQQREQYLRRAKEIKDKFGENSESRKNYGKACSYDHSIEIVKEAADDRRQRSI